MIMRLLILIPVMLIMAIAGYNLYEEITNPEKYYMAMALHATVTILCAVLGWAIVRSAFGVRYSESPETAMA